MNGTTDARGALRDLLDFHFGSRAWLAALFWAVAVIALLVLISRIMNLPTEAGAYVPPEFRLRLVYRAVGCWVVSTLFTYAAGFVMGRLYVPRA
jgi:hypothetical protein